MAMEQHIHASPGPQHGMPAAPWRKRGHCISWGDQLILNGSAMPLVLRNKVHRFQEAHEIASPSSWVSLSRHAGYVTKRGGRPFFRVKLRFWVSITGQFVGCELFSSLPPPTVKCPPWLPRLTSHVLPSATPTPTQAFAVFILTSCMTDSLPVRI